MISKMIGYILSIIILVLGIAENKYLLIQINQQKNVIDTNKNSRKGYRQLNHFRGNLPVGKTNGILNVPITNVHPYGSLPNVPFPSAHPSFPHNPYYLVKGCQNGAGGTFPCSSSMSNQQIAEAACISVYGSCNKAACGSLSYYYSSSSTSCSCTKAVGQYEFIYSNAGYTVVGQDYGGIDLQWSNATSIAGNTLFVRQMVSSSCINSWELTLSDLGSEPHAMVILPPPLVFPPNQPILPNVATGPYEYGAYKCIDTRPLKCHRRRRRNGFKLQCKNRIHYQMECRKSCDACFEYEYYYEYY